MRRRVDLVARVALPTLFFAFVYACGTASDSAGEPGTVGDAGRGADGEVIGGGGDDSAEGGADAAPTTRWTITKAAASTVLDGWPVTNVFDNDAATSWSSAIHGAAQNEEWVAFWFDDFHFTNQVTLTTRFDGTSALGFPVEFRFNWSDGSAWQPAKSVTHFVRPGTQTVTFNLPDKVKANGIQVIAKVLGDDKVGNYVFQLAEVGAGYEASRDGAIVRATKADASNVLAGWPVTNAFDNDPTTSFSSPTYADTAHPESITVSWNEPRDVNVLRILPRYSGAKKALGFPRTFTVSTKEGEAWQAAGSYADFPAPYRGDWIILPLGKTVSTSAIKIDVASLGDDDVGNFVLQVAEIEAGFEAGMDGFALLGNFAGIGGQNEIQNAGSEAINRADQLGHWDYDVRGVVLAPKAGGLGNIYAPMAVNTGGSNWNVYFGGWDGTNDQSDRLSMTTTGDDFKTFGAHKLIVDKGSFIHVNNDCTVRVSATDWRMMSTCYGPPAGNLNKPCYATSTDGVNWTPNAGNGAYLINIAGYAGFASADINGSNVIYKHTDGVWHLYFRDFHDPTPEIHHATSTDFVNFSYVGTATSENVMINDLRAFEYGGTRYYVGAYHVNSQRLWTSISTDLNKFPPLQVAFEHFDAGDNYMVAAGLVQDGARIHGMLYGASSVPSLDQNRIFARWLQKKVIFQNADVRWGDIELGYGPDNVRLIMAAGQRVETGRFYVYDTDGASLLYASPPVTMRAGDVWKYIGEN